MRRILLLLVIATVGKCLNHLGTHLKQRVLDEKFHTFVHKQTHNSSVVACPNFESELKNKTDQMKECIETHFDPDRVGLCHFMSKDFKTCLEHPIKLLTKCLPVQSKDVPQLLLDMVLSLFSFFCKAKGSKILELSQPCLTHGLSAENENECKDELEEKFVKFAYEFPTKSEICGFHKSYRVCLERRLEEQCSSSITRRNFLEFYDAMDKPCKKK